MRAAQFSHPVGDDESGRKVRALRTASLERLTSKFYDSMLIDPTEANTELVQKTRDWIEERKRERAQREARKKEAARA